MKDRWYIADVIIHFSKLKGNVKTESGRRLVHPGEWFMPLTDGQPKGKWISARIPDRVSHQATEQEIKEHFKNRKK